MKKKELLRELEMAFGAYKEKWSGVAYIQIVEQAYQQIVVLIKKPEVGISPRLEYDDDGNVVEMGISGGTEQRPQVTEEWITETAESLLDMVVDNPNVALSDIDNAKSFIRSLVKEIQGVA